MPDLMPVRCRACGEVNMVPIERDFVQIGVPAAHFDEVVRLIARRTKAKPTISREGAPVDPEMLKRAVDMRNAGASYRAVALEMGWTLASTWRRLQHA